MNAVRGCGRIALLLFAAGMLHSAEPQYVVVTGPLLKAPAYFGPAPGTVRLTRALYSGESVEVDPESLKDRPYLYLSEYWGPDWTKFAEGGAGAESLRPGQANWRGRFYPAAGSMPAILELDPPFFPVKITETTYRTLSAEGLQALKDLGIPIRIDR